jgi:hypothetical protein
MRLKAFLYLLALIGFSLVVASPALAGETPEALARLAVSDQPAEAGPAIAQLRAMGPKGLQLLMDNHAEEIRQVISGLPANEQEWQRLSAALDAVSQQRNSYASGLYWYTDFDQALAASRASGKPILSLRLLGKLSEEFSCANSRFFRTVLYANSDVASYLREHFILHWKSVRPAPRVTIDFGDGRKLERTLTGNSIHYVLDSSGSLLDALPGLYGPVAFKRGLTRAEGLAKQLQGKNPSERWVALRAYHDSRIQAIANDWAVDVAKSGGRVPPDVAARIEQRKAAPGAIEVAPVAITKRVVEIDILKAITADATALEAATDLSAWNKIAELHQADALLDSNSIALMAHQNPVLRGDQELLARTVKNLEKYMALDAARNEYMLHTKLHAWFVTGKTGANVETLNERVYAQLFLTPSSDPWLGLYLPDAYSALENGGVSRN